MIDPTHDLPVIRQAELLEISRSNVCYLLLALTIFRRSCLTKKRGNLGNVSCFVPPCALRMNGPSAEATAAVSMAERENRRTQP